MHTASIANFDIRDASSRAKGRTSRAANCLDAEIVEPKRQRRSEAPQACGPKEQRIEVEPQVAVVAGLH